MPQKYLSQQSRFVCELWSVVAARQYCYSTAEATHVKVQTYNRRRCVISCFQNFRVSFELVQLPDRYRIAGDHQYDNCQKACSQTYAYLQIASTKQVRECLISISHTLRMGHAEAGDSSNICFSASLTWRNSRLLKDICFRVIDFFRVSALIPVAPQLQLVALTFHG